jgi:Signal transduction histidine kinase
MQEISLNILDAVQNSIKAGALLIQIEINEAITQNRLTVCVTDNGCGMNAEQLNAVTDPFFTTRKTRKVGLGVPFFKMAAEMTGGSFDIHSELGVGTKLCAEFVYDNIDRMPLGSMEDTVGLLIQCNPGVDFVYKHIYENKSYVLDTREIKKVLEGVPIEHVEVVLYLKNVITENDNDIKS